MNLPPDLTPDADGELPGAGPSSESQNALLRGLNPEQLAAVTQPQGASLILAGAGSGVYNMTRQVGAVLGSAAVGVLMQHEIEDKIAAATGHAQGGGEMATGALPQFLRGPFADAMGSTILLPAAALVVAFVVVQFFATPTHQKAAAQKLPAEQV